MQVSDGNTDSELRIYFCNLTGYFTIQEAQTPDLNEGNPDHQKGSTNTKHVRNSHQGDVILKIHPHCRIQIKCIYRTQVVTRAGQFLFASFPLRW